MAYTPGPFDAAHVYVQWGGKLPGGDEWSCGIRMAVTDGASNSNDPIAMLNGVATAVQTFHVDSRSCISARALLSFVKVNYIDPSGHYAAAVTNEKVIADIPGGSNAADTLPNQVAWAVSLVTGFSRGPAHRGRFYTPLPAITVDPAGLAPVSARDALKTAAEKLRVDLNGVDAGYKVAVFSRKLGAPAHRLVTGVQVGLVLDTQRRRRNKLVEAY